MNRTVIRWKLREVMARYKIKGVDLARALDLSANSISNMRNRDSMPKMDGEALNNLCNALNELAGLEQVITPSSLLGYTQDIPPEEEKEAGEKTDEADNDKPSHLKITESEPDSSIEGVAA